MAFIPNPISNPLLFLVAYFLANMGLDALRTTAELALFSSIIAYPFVFMGDFIYGKLRRKIKVERIVVFYIASFISFVIAWFVLRLWSALLGGEPFIDISVSQLFSSFFAASIIVFVLALFGHYIMRKIELRYEMPKPIMYFIIVYLISLMLWSVVALSYTFLLH